MNALRVIRGVLIRLLQSFALPDEPPVWYRRYLPLVVLVVVIVGGYVVWTWATPTLVSFVDAWTRAPHKDIQGGVNAALVVAFLSAIGFIMTLLNVVVPRFQRDPLLLAVPETLYSWMTGMVAIGIGLLIGTSIFR